MSSEGSGGWGEPPRRPGQPAWGESTWERVAVRRASPGERIGRAFRSVFSKGLLVIVLVLALAGGLIWFAWYRSEVGQPWTAEAGPDYPGEPAVSAEQQTVPLGSPLVAAGAVDASRFMVRQADGTTPVGWDPCRPIHYVVNDKVAPDGGADLIRLAVAQVSEATGLQFVDDGTTMEVPAYGERAPYQPEHYGERWAPVLIAWRNTSDTISLGRGRMGHAYPNTVTDPATGQQRFVSGSITLDATEAGESIEGGRADLVLAIIKHELGHLVGLGHTDGLMADRIDSLAPNPADFTPENLNDLAVAGTRPCYPQLP